MSTPRPRYDYVVKRGLDCWAVRELNRWGHVRRQWVGYHTHAEALAVALALEEHESRVAVQRGCR